MKKTGLFYLIQDLRLALKDHHEGGNTTRPFAKTWNRDEALIEKARKAMIEFDKN